MAGPVLLSVAIVAVGCAGYNSHLVSPRGLGIVLVLVAYLNTALIKRTTSTKNSTLGGYAKTMC